ncbi:MAG: translation initiation factor IF-2 [bacterium]
MKTRPPVVAILGHVDHGKTTLLDYIRKSKLTEKEHGKITQGIGAYEIKTNIKGYGTDKITFIDTPGHEAFSKLRSRGANIADIAILIIDAKDSVMPQTEESISHIKSSKIPFIVALNKVDLKEAKPEKVKLDLLKHDVIVEEKGGRVPCMNISAKEGTGVNELLETILLLTSELNFEYDENKEPVAYIIETKKDKRGLVISSIIKQGRLEVGDTIFLNGQKTKIRSLNNDVGEYINFVLPSSPFEILGFKDFPEVGSIINVSDKKVEKKENAKIQKKTLNIEDLLGQAPGKKLNIILKADSKGSLEAINDTLSKRENIEIIMQGIGNIHKSDVFLATSSKSIILGFNVNVENEARQVAKNEKIIIKSFNIIYELIDELEEVSSLLEQKDMMEKDLKGQSVVLASFIIHDQLVFGIKINKGKINLGDNATIYRDDNLIGKSKLISLQIRSKSVKEVKNGQEAGIMLSPNIDIKVGDVIKYSL